MEECLVLKKKNDEMLMNLSKKMDNLIDLSNEISTELSCQGETLNKINNETCIVSEKINIGNTILDNLSQKIGSDRLGGLRSMVPKIGAIFLGVGLVSCTVVNPIVGSVIVSSVLIGYGVTSLALKN